MAVRNAKAVWEGNLREGKGTMEFGSGAFKGAFSYASRFEEGTGTNPEELIGAAHAGCFSMALSADLGKVGVTPQKISTQASVTLGKVDGKSRITQIHLDCEVQVSGIDEQKFQEVAEGTKMNCPVSAALAGVQISLSARMV